MKIYSYLVLALLLFASCEKEELREPSSLQGSYIGTFQREVVWSESDTANITLTFEENRWTGSSDKNKYPALCNGTFSIDGDTIIFENDCAWTAEFDGTLILDGKYLLTETAKTIEFSRDYRSETKDTYVDKYTLLKHDITINQ
ncbi:hypothetical protein [Sunxiuqinia elliptica]|uniref:Lipocalin-like domain-containing protein n=1 Tax=Sunxiuqinia elliptica TaxID=655355 RepID=A0A1I2JFK7_9BACT|nr:hypothetical protein [Sunxiuqinia elliptica]SFF52878.1 hypothetical protein SAMN05216283_108160 [Sunxiuqinia elliptica]